MDVNMQKKENSVTVKELFDFMLRLYVGQMKREAFYTDGSCENIYKQVVNRIKKQIEEDFSRVEEYYRMLAMADRFYKVVTDEDIRKKVIEKSMTLSEFESMYSDIILGDSKRKYNMSSKYCKGIVADKEGPYGTIKKDIEYEELRREEYPFEDKYGRKIIINEIGNITYTNSFGVGNNTINKYRILKIKENGEKQEYEVFTDIDLSKMSYSEEYRMSVLEELLSDNNITLSNCGGYIGEICINREMQIGEEKDEVDYMYQTSQNYALVFDSEKLSVVIDFEKEKQSGLHDDER